MKEAFDIMSRHPKLTVFLVVSAGAFLIIVLDFLTVWKNKK